MSHQLVYCTVRESKHRVIYVVRVQDEILEPFELENIAELMRDKLAARGELMAEVVTMQGTSRETLRLSGQPLFGVACAHRAVQCGGQLDSHRSRLLKHDPEKWEPVLGKNRAQTRSWSGMMTRLKIVPL
jgi:hypothetical protein